MLSRILYKIVDYLIEYTKLSCGFQSSNNGRVNKLLAPYDISEALIRHQLVLFGKEPTSIFREKYRGHDLIRVFFVNSKKQFLWSKGNTSHYLRKQKLKPQIEISLKQANYLYIDYITMTHGYTTIYIVYIAHSTRFFLFNTAC